jgi:hypothetical protein
VNLSPPEVEVVRGVSRAYESAVTQFAVAVTAGDFPTAERWATIAFALVEALDERGRTYA